MRTQLFAALACSLSLGMASIGGAQQSLLITVENLGPTDGFFLTPTWIGLHGGGFDLFDLGSAASPGVEDIAEQGIVATLQGEFAAPGRLQGVVTGPAGFGSGAGQPPVLDTGETGSTEIAIMNPAAYRYFSFASMVIPSNDAFIGNENPTAYELFDAAGNFNGELTIELTGSDVWDAGTEVNDTFGAAFSTIGGAATDETGTVGLHPGLDNFEGTGTPAGFTVGAGLAPGPNDAFARITVSLVPEPTAALLAGLALAGVAMRRR